MVKKVPQQFQTSDGETFDDEATAVRHQELLDLKSEYESALHKLKVALGKSFQTADGYPFDLHSFGGYYVIHKSFYGTPRMENVSFWVRDLDIDEYGNISVYQARGNDTVMVRHNISQIYKRERNARLALLEAWKENIKFCTEELEALEKSLNGEKS